MRIGHGYRTMFGRALVGATFVCSGVAFFALPLLAQEGGNGGDDEVEPSPPSIGADIPVTYFGPPPSSVEPELIGPLQLLKAGTLDTEAGTLTLPLYRGELRKGKKNVWYILTDTTDEKNAAALGLNFSAKLQAATCRGARDGWLTPDGTLTFAQGKVDFSPERTVVPGAAPHPFPPSQADPGSLGDGEYSPLVRIHNAGEHVYNAPMVAFDVEEEQLDFCDGNVDHSLVHDKVVKICPRDGTVTLALTSGFSFGKPVFYLSTEASVPLAAAFEAVTLAPGLEDVRVGGDDGAFSAVERLFATINGPTGTDNPQRQGFDSALADGRSPLNVLGGIPTVATDYSPLWDLNIGEWTQEAIDLGYRARVTEEFQILGLAANGWITGPGGAPYGSSGIIVNCPIVFRFL